MDEDRDALLQFILRHEKAQKDANLYRVDPGKDRRRTYFYVNVGSDKQLGEFCALLKEHGSSHNICYHWPEKKPVRLAAIIRCPFWRAYETAHPTPPPSPRDACMDTDECEEDQRVAKRARREARKNTTELEAIAAALDKKLKPLLRPREVDLLEVDVDDLLGEPSTVSTVLDSITVLQDPACHEQAYVAFQNAWASQQDLTKLLRIFAWHEDFKDYFAIQFGPKYNNLPFGTLTFPATDEPFETLRDTFLVAKGKGVVSKPTVCLSPAGETAYLTANAAFNKFKADQLARKEDVRYGVAEPFDSKSELDLSSPNLMDPLFLKRIFNYTAFEPAFQYINMFMADCYKQGEVFIKVPNEITRTFTLKSLKRTELKQNYSFLTYEHTDDNGKTKTGNILDFWLSHPDHRTFENITFEPGVPTVIVRAVPNTSSECFLNQMRILNTCPPATYFMYRDDFLDLDPDSQYSLPAPNETEQQKQERLYHRIVAGKGFKIDRPETYFDRATPDESLINMFTRKTKGLQSFKEGEQDLDEKLEQEGKEQTLWVILFHIYYVICNGSRELFDRFNTFYARILFTPMKQDRQFLVIQGDQGSGKTNLVNYIGTYLFGEGSQYHFLGGQSNRLTGRFASQFDNAVLVTLDEATIKDDSETMNTLKSLCTDRTRVSEPKYRESRQIRNYLHCNFVCNQCTLPVEPGDRRYIFFMCNNDLGKFFGYHSVVQPRIASKFGIMCYGMWLQQHSEFLENSYVNFQRSPPMTENKKVCIMNRLRKDAPEVAWWAGCLADGQVRGLNPKRTYLAYEMAWLNDRRSFFDKWVVPIGPCARDTIDGLLCVARDMRDAGEGSLEWVLKKDDVRTQEEKDLWAWINPRKLKLTKKTRHEFWPVQTTWEDMYKAFKELTQNKNSKIMISDFKNSISGCLGVKEIFDAEARDDDPLDSWGKELSNQDEMTVTVKLPCLYAARAQFDYFLKYNGVRDKTSFHFVDNRTRCGPFGQHPEPALVRSDSSASFDASPTSETWISMLRERGRLEKREEPFHRHCDHCWETSELWQEEYAKRGSQGGGSHPAAAATETPGGGAGMLPGQVLEYDTDDYESGEDERAPDSPPAESSSGPQKRAARKSSGRDNRMQPRRRRLGRPPRARVQDAGDEEGVPASSPRDSPRALPSSPDLSALLPTLGIE
jgi:hypothetical protein